MLTLKETVEPAKMSETETLVTVSILFVVSYTQVGDALTFVIPTQVGVDEVIM